MKWENYKRIQISPHNPPQVYVLFHKGGLEQPKYKQ